VVGYQCFGVPYCPHLEGEVYGTRRMSIDLGREYKRGPVGSGEG